MSKKNWGKGGPGEIGVFLGQNWTCEKRKGHFGARICTGEALLDFGQVRSRFGVKMGSERGPTPTQDLIVLLSSERDN